VLLRSGIVRIKQWARVFSVAVLSLVAHDVLYDASATWTLS